MYEILFAQHAAYFLSTLALTLCNKERKKKNAELPTDSVDKFLNIFYIDSYFTYWQFIKISQTEP